MQMDIYIRSPIDLTCIVIKILTYLIPIFMVIECIFFMSSHCWGDECRWKLKTLLLNRLKKQLFYSSFWKTIVKISWYLPRIRRLITSLLLSTTAYTVLVYPNHLQTQEFLVFTLYFVSNILAPSKLDF